MRLLICVGFHRSGVPWLLDTLPTETGTKEHRIKHRIAKSSHNMAIHGVNIENGKPTKWKIENSWGADKPYNGSYLEKQFF